MKKNVILATVAVLLVGVAAYRFFGGTPEDVPPSGGLTFLCTKCNLKFDVPYAQWDRMLQEKRQIKVNPDKTMFITCPKCNDFTAQRFEEPEPPPPSDAAPPPAPQ